MKRRVLLISHGFPPFGGSGMLRTLKFSRYLPDNGWQPIVLTLKKTKHGRYDPRLMIEVPRNTPIIRTSCWEPLALMVAAKNFLKRIKRRRPDSDKHGSGDSFAKTTHDYGSQKESGNFTKFIKDLFTTPDNYAGWFLPGLINGIYAILRHRPCVIYATSPPATAQLIGLCLSKLTGLPLVSDFRDPWTLQYPEDLFHNRKLKWNRQLEKHVLERSSKVICNTDYLAEAFRIAYPSVSSNRFCVITNGFDPHDFRRSTMMPSEDGPFVFIHTGEFFPEMRQRVPDPFLIALNELIREGHVDKENVRVHLVGSGEYTSMQPFLDLVSSPPLNEIVELTEFLPHQEIPGVLGKSHALLLFQNSEHFKMQVPAKTFEYIAAARTILAITYPGATASLVQSVKGGYVVHPEDLDAIKKTVLKLIIERNACVELENSELLRFDRRELTHQLSKVLTNAAADR